MALCGGALRRWLEERGELPDDPLVAFVPMSVRGAERFGNRFSSLVARIPTDGVDARERVFAAHTEMSSCKRRHQSVPDTLLADLNALIPPVLLPAACRIALGLVASRRIRPPVNLIVSNIPGSPAPLYCAGSSLAAHFPLSLIFNGVGLNITVVSYQDQFDIGIVANAAALPDAWELMDLIKAELKELAALAKLS